MARSEQHEGWQQSIYHELHQIAERALRLETPGHSLQPTLLVHDAYMRLKDQANLAGQDRHRFLAAGAVIIRRLLVDYARKRKASKRGGEKNVEDVLHISTTPDANTVDVLELNDALEVLAKKSPRAARVVELRFFGGLTSDEVADELGVSLSTMNSDWKFAKAWLYRELEI